MQWTTRTRIQELELLLTLMGQMWKLVEWIELCDGEVGKVGPSHLNHLEGGGRCAFGREGEEMH